MNPVPDWNGLRALLATRKTEDCGMFTGSRSAILVPVLLPPSGPELLFTVRSRNLRRHPGQIAFPGGHVDPGETLLQAALRETDEEVGVQVRPGDVLGQLDSQPSPTGSCATPFVATVDWPQQLVLSDLEVDSTFTVPLAELQQITPESRLVHHNDFSRLLHTYNWQDRQIWGLTGNVLHQLLTLLKQLDQPAVTG